MADDQDAMAEEWAAMADEDVGEGDAGADDLAAEWAAMAEGGDEGGGAARVLNQDEIDSLLGFQEGGDDDGSKSGIEAIIDSGMVSYERLPMLEIVYDRLVRMMSTRDRKSVV